MKTDAKLGFAIVGILLAVLGVYTAVVPKASNSKTEEVDHDVHVDVPLHPSAEQNDFLKTPAEQNKLKLLGQAFLQAQANQDFANQLRDQAAQLQTKADKYSRPTTLPTSAPG